MRTVHRTADPGTTRPLPRRNQGPLLELLPLPRGLSEGRTRGSTASVRALRRPRSFPARPLSFAPRWTRWAREARGSGPGTWRDSPRPGALSPSAPLPVSSPSRLTRIVFAGSRAAPVTSAGLKTLLPVPTFEDVSIPEKPKLKFVERAPLVPKVRREPKNLSDIRGPSTEATEFTEGNFGILALGGGYLHWGHFEMMRLTINRSMDVKNMFAIWRVPAPFKPITRKGVGQRMGGGKGAIDHYVTPVKTGRLLVEIGGRCEFKEVQGFLNQVAHKLPFPAKAVSRETLEKMHKDQEEREQNNQNPWTFERIATANMLGIRKVLSPYDLTQKGRYWGKFFLPKRV
ncbi:39S ribosomal protein L16, mitochondrial [Fukomys damarensis]|uniref:39S ribosomal protein L16, mitochondrial n=1 Tax=Fukomys damarensis TaxID=885580 RepID=UPI00053FB305|nr:39S ribosomal protein L16, mitochondrial [Fukomys damarensis]